MVTAPAAADRVSKTREIFLFLFSPRQGTRLSATDSLTRIRRSTAWAKETKRDKTVTVTS